MEAVVLVTFDIRPSYAQRARAADGVTDFRVGESVQECAYRQENPIWGLTS